MKYLIVIGGATATGKTAFAIRLAQHFNTAILSADSRQFYREMSIGTAKPSPEELAAAPHYFIDTLSIREDYSVGDYERDALAVLQDIYRKKDLAIVVGGSGLYLRALCEGLDAFPDISEATKEQVARQTRLGGLAWMQQTLQALDPIYFSEVDTQNPVRLRRALEVCLETGKPFSAFRKNTKTPRDFQPIHLLLDLPRTNLYTRIDARVDQMILNGLEEEARLLLPFREKPALKTVGYEEFFDYFDGKLPLEATISKIKQHSRNYAKRQATWFRKHGDWAVFHPEQFQEVLGFLLGKMK